jgi:WD40 repeat protein
VNSLAVLPENKLASGSGDNTIRIWDTEKRIELKRSIGHTKFVSSLAALLNNTLLSGSQDVSH